MHNHILIYVEVKNYIMAKTKQTQQARCILMVYKVCRPVSFLSFMITDEFGSFYFHAEVSKMRLFLQFITIAIRRGVGLKKTCTWSTLCTSQPSKVNYKYQTLSEFCFLDWNNVTFQSWVNSQVYHFWFE